MMIIFLLGPMSLSLVGGLGTVICHGSDGHLALEPAVHHHCDCSDSGDKAPHDKPAGTSLEWAARHDHEHCTDTTAAFDCTISVRKAVKCSLQKVFATIDFVKTTPSRPICVLENMTASGHEYVAFYTPLRAIILLA